MDLIARDGRYGMVQPVFIVPRVGRNGHRVPGSKVEGRDDV